MTLAAPRSRQGKLLLVLAFLAAVTATVGALVWASQASANLPTTTLTFSQSPAAPATVTPGTLVTYTITLTTTGANTNGNVVLTAVVDADLANTTVSCSTPAGGVAWAPAGAGTNTLTCTSAGVATNINPETMIVTGQANGDISAPTVSVADADNVSIPGVGDGSVGTLTGGALGTVENATNFPGTPHTFVFNLNAGVTCESDATNNENVDCAAGDVTTGGAVTCTAGAPVVGDADLVDASTVTVTVTPADGTSGDCTVTLAVKFVGIEDSSTDNCCNSTIVATKTYSLAVGAGVLRHLDIPDAATEDAAGIDTDTESCSTSEAVPVCGILSPQTDIDDAIGSFHGACIERSGLTYAANGADITWSITPVAGGPNPSSVQGFEGPNGEPCVMWGAGSVGTQQITAVFDNGLAPAITYYWNESCVAGNGCTDAAGDPTTDGPLPLIKEWNTIDFTKIISVSGNVGDTLDDNTGQLGGTSGDWINRDCIDSEGLCGAANYDGSTVNISGGLDQLNQNVISAGASFIDYTMGSHNDAGGAYNGPVDGAEQTYSVSGDCGAVRLEDPATGQVIILSVNGQAPSSATVLSSDKGVGFQVVPNFDGAITTSFDNSDCSPDSCTTVTIATQEDNLFHSPPLFVANEEVVTVCFHVGPPTNKQPLLAWAGQRVVLEHDWSFTDPVSGVRTCPFNQAVEGPGFFFVRYLKQSGNGAFVDDLGSGSATGPDFMVVQVASEGNSNEDPNANCISRVVYEAEDQGEQDLSANVVFCPTFLSVGAAAAQVQGDGPRQFLIDPDTCSVDSEQVPFLVYYMKFEDINLTLLPDQTTHSPGTQSSTAVGAPAGASSTEANVSANVLARATVRGWTLTDNCPARESAVGSNGEFIPANRCIWPDDWRFKAGGDTAEEARPNYDIYGGSTVGCSGAVAGPFSQLDAPGCGGSLAPHANGGQRETNFPDGTIDANDAPMPSALIRFALEGSGFLVGTAKANPNSQFDVTHIPAEPWIAPIDADGEGYLWNSYGNGAKSGVYDYWTDIAAHSDEVLSCAGPSEGAVVSGPGEQDQCPATDNQAAVHTGGYSWTKVYSDEHGVAMTWINGDANLTFEDCAGSADAAGGGVVQLSGFICQSGDTVGHTTLNALADYPDKRKHFAIQSDDVTIDWTWGGIKSVSVEPGEGPQFNYVVLHVTDRDGFCGNSPSLHPVLGEDVTFTIDSPTGIIFDNQNGDASAFGDTPNNSKIAHVTTFDTDSEDTVDNGGLTVDSGAFTSGECQAWIHVSESQLSPVNVVVLAEDPEGTVTFDTQDINPTPTPSPTPAPTPEMKELIWGDWNCDGDVNLGDAIAIARDLVDLAVTQGEGCPAMGSTLSITQNSLTQDRVWGDTDCNTQETLGDAIKIVRALVDLEFTTFADCPGLFLTVTTPAS